MTDAPGSGAASVASQLIAFFREPARFRPHYIHGDERLPEGHVVLKFALGRFSRGWHRDLSHHDQEELTEAARSFVRQVCLWERATPYQVLCLGRDAPRDAIKENYRLLMALLHPDRPDALAHAWPDDCAQRVNDAYATLSDDALRSAYDTGIRKAHYSGAFEHPAPSMAKSAPTPRRGGWARSLAVVSAVVAALFVAQSWWVGDQPEHYALLERALPLRAS
nr:J domain-containing protein [Pseudomonadota bacterium]